MCHAEWVRVCVVVGDERKVVGREDACCLHRRAGVESSLRLPIHLRLRLHRQRLFFDHPTAGRRSSSSSSSSASREIQILNTFFKLLFSCLATMRKMHQKERGAGGLHFTSARLKICSKSTPHISPQPPPPPTSLLFCSPPSREINRLLFSTADLLVHAVVVLRLLFSFFWAVLLRPLSFWEVWSCTIFGSKG